MNPNVRPITESQNNLGWKGPERPPHTTPCRGQGHLPLSQAAPALSNLLEHFQSCFPLPLCHLNFLPRFLSGLCLLVCFFFFNNFFLLPNFRNIFEFAATTSLLQLPVITGCASSSLLTVGCCVRVIWVLTAAGMVRCCGQVNIYHQGHYLDEFPGSAGTRGIGVVGGGGDTQGGVGRGWGSSRASSWGII